MASVERATDSRLARASAVDPHGHGVRIRLLRLTDAGVVDPRGPILAQWEAVCLCGWRCLSWKWDHPWRGVLPVSLDHLEAEAEPSRRAR